VAENIVEAVAKVEGEKSQAKPVVIPAAPPVQAQPTAHKGKKWAESMEYERIELLRNAVYLMQKQVATLQTDLTAMRQLLKKHVHTASGDVALTLEDVERPAPGTLADLLA
jgi:hypothetical protein